jgi:hypothetical protein
MHSIADGGGIPVWLYDSLVRWRWISGPPRAKKTLMKRIPTINILLIGMVVMMLGFSSCMFKMRMVVANKVGLFMIIGLVILIGGLAKLGGEHKRKRLAEEERLKQLTAPKQKPGRKPR